MHRLKLEYLAESPQRIAELRAHLAAAESGAAGALDELRRAFHKLAGSGGSYGLPEVSDAARSGETTAQSLLAASGTVSPGSLGELRSHIEAVAAAFGAARAAEGD
jgi:HPt (histidine-containing phosphotransfer) domain-containing protein